MPLDKLLDTASFRRFELIELLVSDDIWLTIEVLSNQLNCSRRTLITDIQMINSRSGDNFFIETSKQRGVKLITTDSFHMEDVYEETMKSSLNFQIIKEIIELNHTTCEVLSERLFTSQSSINRSLKQIELFLIDYDLVIESNPIRLTGTEKQIRYFTTIFLCEYYSSNRENFHHPLKKVSSDLLAQIESEKEVYQHSFLTHYRTLIWLIVCLERMSKGHFIEKGYPLPLKVDSKIEHALSKLTNQLPFELPKKEKSFIMHIYWNNHRKFDETDLASDQSLKSMHQTIFSFIEDMKEKTGYTVEEEKLLIANLMRYNLFREFFKGPSNLLFNPKRKIYGNSLATFDEFISAVKSTVTHYPESSFLHGTQLDEWILTLILFWPDLVTQINSKKEKIQILIISYIGIHQELFLSDMLRARFPTMVECYVGSEKVFHQKNIQLVITDYSVKWMEEEMGDSKKVIGVDFIPTKRDWKKIRKMINKFR